MSGSPFILLPFAQGLWEGDPSFALEGTGTSQPPGLEAVLEYNGMIFHDRKVVDKYRVLSIDGLSDADIRDVREVNPAAHGETAFDAYYGGRTLLLTGRIEAYTLPKLRDMQQALRTALVDLQEKPLYFRLGSIDKDVMIRCRKIDKLSMREEQTKYNIYQRDFQISLRASDPRFVSVQARSYDFSPVVIETFDRGPDAANGYTNLITNPNFQAGLTGWDALVSDRNVAGATLSQIFSDGPAGSTIMGVVTTTVGQGADYKTLPVVAGQTYEISAYVRAGTGSVGKQIHLEAGDNTVGKTDSAITTLDSTATWQRIVFTWTPTASGTTGIAVLTDTAVNDFRVDAVMVTTVAGQEYFDGSFSNARWIGAVNASASTQIMGKKNFITNPSFYLDATNWLPTGSNTLTRSSTASRSPGLVSLTGGGVLTYQNNLQLATHLVNNVEISVRPGQYIVASAWINQAVNWDGGDIRLESPTVQGTLTAIRTDASTPLPGQWQRIGYVYKNTGTTNATIQSLRVMAASAPTAGRVIWLDEIMLTVEDEDPGAGSYPDYFDGWTSSATQWEGVYYNSVSIKYDPNPFDDYAWEPVVPVGVPAAGTWQLENGVLRRSPNLAGFPVGQMYYTSLGFKPTDVTLTIKHTMGTTTTDLWGFLVRRKDTTNYVRAYMGVNKMTAEIIRGSTTAVASTIFNDTTTLAIAAGATTWTRLIVSGDNFTMEHWTTDPALGGTAAKTVTAQPAGGTFRTEFGAGIAGDVGIYWQGATGGHTLDDFKIEPINVNAQALVVQNLGNFPAQPRIRLYGPITNPEVINNTLMPNETAPRRLKLIGTIASGAWVEYDSSTGTLVDNLGNNQIAMMDIASRDFLLAPGDNSITLIASGMSGGTGSVRMRFWMQDTWM